jgi:alpha-methylacyl-CoA racemase
VLRETFAAAFNTRTRDEWAVTFADTDACVTPVLDRDEVAADPHLASRQTMIEVGGVTQPAPAPRFSKTVLDRPSAPVAPGTDTREILRDAGFGGAEIETLIADQVVYEASP